MKKCLFGKWKNDTLKLKIMTNNADLKYTNGFIGLLISEDRYTELFQQKAQDLAVLETKVLQLKSVHESPSLSPVTVKIIGDYDQLAVSFVDGEELLLDHSTIMNAEKFQLLALYFPDVFNLSMRCHFIDKEFTDEI